MGKTKQYKTNRLHKLALEMNGFIMSGRKPRKRPSGKSKKRKERDPDGMNNRQTSTTTQRPTSVGLETASHPRGERAEQRYSDSGPNCVVVSYS